MNRYYQKDKYSQLSFKDCVGKKILRKTVCNHESPPIEIKVLAVSPNGKFVKFEDEDNGFWDDADKYIIGDILE